MILIVLVLLALALLLTNGFWALVAAPFVAEIAVILATRALLRRDRPIQATLVFVWGSLVAIVPFVALFPIAYPASLIAVAQIEAIALWYLHGRALAATLVGMTMAAGLVAALGSVLGPTGTQAEKAVVTSLVFLSFALLSVVLGLNQARLRRALSEAHEARDHLEETVATRTAALRETAQQLQAANVATEAATRAKTEFLANMSHELRTPMNAILGFSDLLVEQLGDKLAPAQQRYFRNIKDAGNHLLELINEVLDLSKVEAGRLELRPESVRLSTLVEPVVASGRGAATEAGLSLDVALPTDRMVNVDAGRVRQVLYNLLSNAVKFTPRGGRVDLRAATDGRDLVIEVSDTGIGIPADKRDRVFGTFERLHEGRSEAAGTGLGLALTKRLVELHGGTISFDSVEGRGTTFRVRLADAVYAPVTGPRLLLVEDDRRDAELLAAIAQDLRVPVEIVATAASARDSVRRDPPAAVILDLRLPDERGERFLTDLKADASTSSIPVLVVTVEDDEGRSRPLGADDHLTKPIERDRVAAWIRTVLARRSGAASAARER
jgi:signal transduction histidine kinase